MEWFLFGGVAFGILSAVVASNKSRNALGWFLCGLFLGPFGFILSLVVSKNQVEAADVARCSPGSRKCPYCAESIKFEAIKCRFCQADLADYVAGEKKKSMEKALGEAKSKTQAENEERLIGLYYKSYAKRDSAACCEHLDILLSLYPDGVYSRFAKERLVEIRKN